MLCLQARHILQLYRGQVYDSCLAHYSEAATFEDPALALNGTDEIKHVFRSRKRQLNPVQISSEIEYSPDRIRIRLLQQYTLPLSSPLNLPSLVVLHLDDDGKIARHEELWNGQPLFEFGAAMSRRLNGLLAAAFS